MMDVPERTKRAVEPDQKLSVSVVICTYNRCGLLRECVASLLDQAYPTDDYEIIVVDDGSTDGTDALLEEMAASPGPPLRHFRQENRGSATARNLGISQARGEIIASIDDDCVATATWIENAVPHFAKDTVVGVQGRTLPAEPVRLHFLPPRFSYTIEVTKEVPNHPTCNVLYRRQAILDVGGFNEKFKMTGAEDADLAFRIARKGKVVFDPGVLVHHAVFYDTLTDRLRFMKRFQYEPLLIKEYPHLRKDLLLGFVYSKEVVHAPFFFVAALAGLLSAVAGASPLPVAILGLVWFVVYLWSNVTVDRHLAHYPLRIALAPTKLLLHSTKLYYHLAGSIRYRSLII
jgi:glycosyltransferase involved in cell wall biosynthesis